MSGDDTARVVEKEWRWELLRRILLAAVVLGGLVMIPSLLLSWRDGLWFVFVADSVAYAMLLLFTFLPNIPYTLRALFFVGMTFFIGAMLLIVLGVAAASFLWILASVLTALLLLGRKWALAATIGQGVILALVTLLLIRGELRWEMNLPQWFTYLANLLAITGFLVSATAFLLRRVFTLYQQEHALNREKQELIREIQHRVKNNLQLMVSLLRVQGGGETNPSALRALQSSEVRVKAMSLVHEVLYRKEVEQAIGLAEFLPFFVEELSDFFPANVTTQVEAEPITLVAEQAIPFSILLGELMSNAYRHAYTEEVGGEVKVRVARLDSMLSLVVEDRGVGFKPDEVAGGVGVGITIAQALTEQLSGNLQWEDRNPGAMAIFQMPL